MNTRSWRKSYRMTDKPRLPHRWHNSKPVPQTPRRKRGDSFIHLKFYHQFYNGLFFLLFLAPRKMRQRPVRRKHLRHQPAPTPAHMTAPTTKDSRDRQAIKANISTLVGEVISILLLVDGARAIIRSKATASSRIGSIEFFKEKKRVSKQRQNSFHVILSSPHTQTHTHT